METGFQTASKKPPKVSEVVEHVFRHETGKIFGA
jgi:hypothetical protein